MYVFTAIYPYLCILKVAFWCIDIVWNAFMVENINLLEYLVRVHKHSNPFKPFIIIIEQLQLHDMWLIVTLLAITKVLLCHHLVTPPKLWGPWFAFGTMRRQFPLLSFHNFWTNGTKVIKLRVTSISRN
jgi:hypothetical protein